MSGIKHYWNGTILTIESDSGISSADLKGEKGDTGIRGPAGAQGEGKVLSVNGRIGDVVITADEIGSVNQSYVDTAINNIVVPTKVSELENDAGYLTEHQSLTNYYTKTEVDALIPDTSNFITSIPAEYITETELNSKGYTTMSAVESKGYQTAGQVNTLINNAIANITDGEEVSY